ncbi:MAG: hypothetical protein IPG99_07930 [Ignavibacteria bacterium]|nr:hypothetical protein [Ignavibacteria bacterium]
MKRHFTITPLNNSALNATFIFRYDPTDLDTINESSLGLYRSTNSGLNYFPEGGVVDTASNQITLNFCSVIAMFSAGRILETLNNGLELTDNIYAKGKLCINWGSIDSVRVRINRSEIPQTIR